MWNGPIHRVVPSSSTNKSDISVQRTFACSKSTERSLFTCDSLAGSFSDGHLRDFHLYRGCFVFTFARSISLVSPWSSSTRFCPSGLCTLIIIWKESTIYSTLYHHNNTFDSMKIASHRCWPFHKTDWIHCLLVLRCTRFVCVTSKAPTEAIEFTRQKANEHWGLSSLHLCHPSPFYTEKELIRIHLKWDFHNFRICIQDIVALQRYSQSTNSPSVCPNARVTLINASVALCTSLTLTNV